MLTTIGLPSEWQWLFRVSSSRKNFSASMAILPSRSDSRSGTPQREADVEEAPMWRCSSRERLDRSGRTIYDPVHTPAVDHVRSTCGTAADPRSRFSERCLVRQAVPITPASAAQAAQSRSKASAPGKIWSLPQLSRIDRKRLKFGGLVKYPRAPRSFALEMSSS